MSRRAAIKTLAPLDPIAAERDRLRRAIAEAALNWSYDSDETKKALAAWREFVKAHGKR